MTICQEMFLPVETFHVSGGRRPTDAPEAEGPRNPGQLAGAAESIRDPLRTSARHAGIAITARDDSIIRDCSTVQDPGSDVRRACPSSPLPALRR